MVPTPLVEDVTLRPCILCFLSRLSASLAATFVYVAVFSLFQASHFNPKMPYAHIKKLSYAVRQCYTILVLLMDDLFRKLYI